MKTNFTSKENVSPVAYIAKSKQRIKQYGNIVYLKNKEEFQIELFNPTSTKILARIELNGNSIGPGIIIRPGERIFLDRYVTEARKFLFETYNVNGNNKDVQKAIEPNGDVVVTFFKESIPENFCYTNTLYVSNTNPTNTQFHTTYYKNSANRFCAPYSLTTSNSFDVATPTCDTLDFNCDYTSDFDTKARGIVGKHFSKTIETGRVEKGSVSDQKFMPDSTKFEQGYSWKSEWKLLPESRKEVTIDELVQYCVVCGRRKRHNNEAYCPSCGTKF